MDRSGLGRPVSLENKKGKVGEAQERRETEKKKDKSQTRKKKKKNKPAKAKVFTFKMPPNFSKSELEELKSDIVRPKVPFVVNG